MSDSSTAMKKWYRKKKWWFIAAGFVIIIVLFFVFRDGKKPTYESIIAKKSDLIQEVSVTGKITPAQDVDLQFESSGRISAINYKVGDKVNAGATIASLDNLDLQAAVTSARADLEKTVRNFNSLNDSSVSSSLRVELENSKINLEQVMKKADGDLASEYSDAFNAIREAMTQINTSSAVLEYIRKTYFEANYTWSTYITDRQTEASLKISQVRSIFPQIDQPGVTITPAMYSKIDMALQEILSGCQSLRSAFTYLQEQIQGGLSLVYSATDRASINTEATAVSSDLSAISSAIQAIASQKILNNKNIADAEAKLATAKAAFPTSEDILQKEAALSTAQSQLRKSLIIAPFTGIIGKIDAEKGETVSSSTPIVSLISSAKYQIEANITEVDIGKVSVGNKAVLTLDSYGSQTKFSAVISSVDTSATIVEGVTTYKTVFDFEGDIDQGIRPNMTANIDIQTAKKENIISIPQRAVITKGGDKIVRIYKGDEVALEERIVKTGMSGKDGYIEIIDGLSEGENVITFINE